MLRPRCVPRRGNARSYAARSRRRAARLPSPVLRSASSAPRCSSWRLRPRGATKLRPREQRTNFARRTSSSGWSC
eukprot:1474412-Prymnesium_polylepis.1